VSDFSRAVTRLLRHEGGYTIDTGGPTNYGITVPVLTQDPHGDLDHDGDIDADDIRLLTPGQARTIYLTQWWERYRYNRMYEQIPASHALDFAVNFGPVRGHKILQMALRAMGCREIRVDGILGPFSIERLNTAAVAVLDAAIRASAAGEYRVVAAHNPTRYGQYLDGWLARAYDPWRNDEL